MNRTNFENLIIKARIATLEVLEDIKNIANGSLTIDEIKIRDGEEYRVSVVPKFSDRIAAAKLLKDIVMNKEALGVKDVDEYDLLTPFEKKRLIMEALDEVNHEIAASQ